MVIRTGEGYVAECFSDDRFLHTVSSNKTPLTDNDPPGVGLPTPKANR